MPIAAKAAQDYLDVLALRKGAKRTVNTLIKLIGRLVKTFAPGECTNYFRHAGYGK